MKEKITITFKPVSHTEVELVNKSGDTFTFDASKHEDLLDFLTMGVDEDDSIDYHLERIKAIQNSHDKNGFKKKQGSLMAKVFLRRTGAINDHKGNYVINEKDIVGWFENGDYLKMVTEWDTM